MVKRPVLGNQPDALSQQPDAVLDDKIQRHLGTMLQRHYDDIANAPIPDQFLVLLAELEAKEQANGR